MIDFARAYQIARTYVAHISRADNPCVIIEDATLEEEFGWVFFYQSERFLQTRDVRRDALFGNAPVIVDRNDGSIYVTGTGKPIQYYIEIFREQRRTDHTLLERLKHSFTRRSQRALSRVGGLESTV